MGGKSNDGMLDPFFSVLQRSRKPVRNWILLTGKRRHVVAAIFAVVFLVILIVGVSEGWSSDEKLFGQTGAVRTIFNTLLSGVILLISIVVSINSIIVSKELSELGKQEERVEDSLDFRRRADEKAEAVSVSSSEPGNYLHALVEAIDEKAGQLRDETYAADGGLREGEEEFLAEVDEHSDTVLENLKSISGSPFDVFSAGLTYDHSLYLDQTYRLQRQYREEFSEEREEAYEELLDLLQILETALQYFKSIYYQEEFANLSRDLLYTGLPAVLLIAYVILWLGPKSFPGLVPGVEWVLGVKVTFISVFVSAAFAVALLPFIVLTAYVLRAAAVTKRTLAAGPFVFEE